jgi:serine/threonine protein phosphatase PrpC
MESPDTVLLAVADGMGGHPRGEMAAQILMDTARKSFLTSRKPIANPRVLLSGVMDLAHQEILKFGRNEQPPIEPRTTGVLCLIQENQAYWAHIGDSRLYIMHDGVIALRTDDHSYVEQLRQQGLISSAQTQTHRFRNYVTRCLGGENNQPYADLGGPHSLVEGDTILLCTDGFWSALPDRPLVETIYKDADNLDECIDQLVSQAETNSQPESDNVTAVSLRFKQKKINIAPADISMSLKDNPSAQDKLKQQHDSKVDDAINMLRELIDNNPGE